MLTGRARDSVLLTVAGRSEVQIALFLRFLRLIHLTAAHQETVSFEFVSK